ncbi:DUF4270 family protein [Leptobacterium flavescens]|uniref:DUF4270 family protein n=1 Tax=Leptobacterium flavescens TaxID=472055 RepID=A0A6P0UPU4_9FLAO|nr:DUF4270 domain-containing protein [Leptobacterium flavescens]NER14490.1 DUF4270 family protein [Leptobacterium flavescens]
MMNILNGKGLKVLIPALIITLIISCEDDFSTVGTDIIGTNNFETERESFDVFASTRVLNSVQSNGLAVYQLGRLTDPIYGTHEAGFVSQLSIPSDNPRFGNNSQEQEDVGDSDEIPTTIQENEEVNRVFLNIPFFLANSAANDDDNDGVVNSRDVNPNDPNSDSDNDGVTDFEERVNGTDPLNPDTDGDGIVDGSDEDTQRDIFPNTFELDSIFGNEVATFDLRVEQLTFFLRDLDPNTGFQDAQEYFSTMDFNSFTGATLFDGNISISPRETVIFGEDDPDTPDVDESTSVTRRIPPGIRVELDPTFFQENLIDMEGDARIANNQNLRDFFRGIRVTTSNHAEDILILFNLSQANIEVEYSFDRANQQGTLDDESDDTIDRVENTFTLTLGGNMVNTFNGDPLSNEILTEINRGTDASRLYLTPGGTTFVEMNLFDEEGSSTVLDQIRTNDWLINEANLVFTIDRDQLDIAGSRLEPNRLYLYNLENNTTIVDYLLDPTQQASGNNVESRTVYGGIIETNDEGRGTQYKIRLTEHINRIIRNDSTNVKLGLAVTANINNSRNITGVNADTDEFRIPQASVSNAFGTILFGGNTPGEEDKELKLEIFYTIPKNN